MSPKSDRVGRKGIKDPITDKYQWFSCFCEIWRSKSLSYRTGTAEGCRKHWLLGFWQGSVWVKLPKTDIRQRKSEKIELLRRFCSFFGGFWSNYPETLERINRKRPANRKTLGGNPRNQLNKPHFKLEIE